MGNLKDIGSLAWSILTDREVTANSLLQDFKYNKRKKIFKRLVTEQIVRSAVQIKDWREALDAWEDKNNPDREKMMELYQEIELDDQVTAKVGAMKERINASEFYFYDEKTGGELSKETQRIFDHQWFYDYMEYALESKMYGHSLIQFGDFNKNRGYFHREIELVPRHLVSPEMGIVRFTSSVMEGIPFREGIYANGLVEVGKNYSKGLFASVAPLYIFKKNAMIFWQDFQQRFGEPMITFNTDITNDENVKRLLEFIQTRGRNSGAVMDKDEVANLLEAEKTDAFRVYHEMINLCNAGISKTIGGEIMTTDSSDGKYKGDVHADTALLYHLGRQRFLRFTTDDELIPKMIRDGFDIPSTTRMAWRQKLDIDEIVNRLTKLLNYYKIDPKKIYELTGIEVGKEREDIDGRLKNMKQVPDKNDK